MPSTDGANQYSDTPPPTQSSDWVPTQDPALALQTAPRTQHEVQQAPQPSQQGQPVQHSQQIQPSQPVQSRQSSQRSSVSQRRASQPSAPHHAGSDSGLTSSQSPPSSPNSTVGHRERSLEPLASLPPRPLSSSRPRRPRSQRPDSSYQPEVHVYTADTVTYADLDPKAFMRPENRVLPTSDLKGNSKTAYAMINVSRSQLV